MEMDIKYCESCGWHHDGIELREYGQEFTYYICPMTRQVVEIGEEN